MNNFWWMNTVWDAGHTTSPWIECVQYPSQKLTHPITPPMLHKKIIFHTFQVEGDFLFLRLFPGEGKTASFSSTWFWSDFFHLWKLIGKSPLFHKHGHIDGCSSWICSAFYILIPEPTGHTHTHIHISDVGAYVLGGEESSWVDDFPEHRPFAPKGNDYSIPKHPFSGANC